MFWILRRIEAPTDNWFGIKKAVEDAPEWQLFLVKDGEAFYQAKIANEALARRIAALLTRHGMQDAPLEEPV